MMEEELRQLLKKHGWNLFTRMRHFKRTGNDKEYFYAQKWKKGEVYITSQTKLPTITAEEVLQKIGASEDR